MTMVKSTKNLQTSKRIYYSLLEASKIANCAPEQLLHYGSIGKIKLCTKIPSQLALFQIDYRTLQLDIMKIGSLERKMTLELLRGYEPIKEKEIDFVILSNEDCKKLESIGDINQNIFNSAIQITKEQIPILKIPANISRSQNSGFHGRQHLSNPIFATYSSEYNGKLDKEHTELRQNININIFNIFIANEDVLICINSELTHNFTNKDNHNHFLNNPYTSSKLRSLIDAEQHYRRLSEERELTSEEFKEVDRTIKAKLLKSGFENENTINEALYIIRPESTHKFSSIHQKRKEQNLTTPRIKDLIEASDMFWKNVDFHDKNTYAKKSDVFNFLRYKMKFGIECSQAIARIIRPDNLKRGRPPKEK